MDEGSSNMQSMKVAFSGCLYDIDDIMPTGMAKSCKYVGALAMLQDQSHLYTQSTGPSSAMCGDHTQLLYSVLR